MMSELAVLQEMGGLSDDGFVEQHACVRNGQDDVVAHPRALGFFDQDGAVIFASQTKYQAHAVWTVACKAAQFDAFGQFGGVAIKGLAVGATQ